MSTLSIPSYFIDDSKAILSDLPFAGRAAAACPAVAGSRLTDVWRDSYKMFPTGLVNDLLLLSPSYHRRAAHQPTPAT